MMTSIRKHKLNREKRGGTEFQRKDSVEKAKEGTKNLLMFSFTSLNLYFKSSLSML